MRLENGKEPIIVAGYPKSGNTWLSWLLGDTFNCSVGGYHGAKRLCTEGEDRLGNYHVMQLHVAIGQ